MRYTTLLQVVSLLVLLGLSAFFSGSEAAIFSLSPHRLRRLVSEKAKSSGILAGLLSRSQRTLIDILMGNALVNVGASFFAALLSFKFADRLGFDQTFGMSAGVGVMTFFLLVFGEISPKLYSLERAERVSLRNAPILVLFSVLFWPVSYVLELIVGAGLRGTRKRGLVTVDEMKTMLEMGRESKTLRSLEHEVIGNVFDFASTTVKEIMTPRSDLFSLPRDLSISEVRDLARKRRHSRIAIHDENVDDVVGVLHIKDMLTADLSETDSVLNLARPAYFVPETMSISGLLEEFQRRKIHFAVVVDEHGGTVGAVTLDDILGEIVGDITEEKRVSDRPSIVALGKEEYLVDGYASLDDLREELDLELPVDDFNTLSGLIYNLAGKVPAERQLFEYAGASYEVMEMKGTRITKVRVKRTR